MDFYSFLNSQSDDRLVMYAIVVVLIVMAVTNMFVKIFTKKK